MNYKVFLETTIYEPIIMLIPLAWWRHQNKILFVYLNGDCLYSTKVYQTNSYHKYLRDLKWPCELRNRVLKKVKYWCSAGLTFKKGQNVVVILGFHHFFCGRKTTGLYLYFIWRNCKEFFFFPCRKVKCRCFQTNMFPYDQLIVFKVSGKPCDDDNLLSVVWKKSLLQLLLYFSAQIETEKYKLIYEWQFRHFIKWGKLCITFDTFYDQLRASTPKAHKIFQFFLTSVC